MRTGRRPNRTRVRSLESTIDRASRPDAGFTLIELLVIVLIIGVLAAIGVPVYQTALGAARDAAMKSELGSAKIVMVGAYVDGGSYPETIPDLVAAGFTPTLATPDGYTVSWEMAAVDADGFCLKATSDVPTTVREFWITESSAVVGPIDATDAASRPAGCPAV